MTVSAGATGRLLPRLREQHPKLNILVIEDGLASNAPHIADLVENKMHYLLGAKPGDHQHLFDQAIEQLSHLRHFEFNSFADLYRAIASGRLCKPPPVR